MVTESDFFPKKIIVTFLDFNPQRDEPTVGVLPVSLTCRKNGIIVIQINSFIN